MKITLTKSIFTPPGATIDVPFQTLVKYFKRKLMENKTKGENDMFLCADMRQEDDPDVVWNDRGYRKRCDANVISLSALVFDVDNDPEKPVLDPHTFAEGLGVRCLLGTSASSSTEFPRCRIVCPATRPMTPDEYRRIQRHVLANHDYPALDRSCAKPSQPYYFPQNSRNPFVRVIEGDLFDADKMLALIPSDPAPRPHGTLLYTSAASLERAAACLQHFDPNSEDDRWKTASAFYKTFGDIAEGEWQNWYRGATNWTAEKADKKWRDARTSPEINIGFIFKRAS
jgi:hypothetical protein